MTPDCIDDNDAARLVAGDLDDGSRRRIEDHVDSCTSCRLLVAELARQSAPVQPSDALLRPGATVGRYVIGGLIGAGAMGVIYSAEDPQLGRHVALKLLRPRFGHSDPTPPNALATTAVSPEALDSGSAEAQLLAEAQALAKLAHPNVVTVFDAGRWRDRVFIALELVRGGTLAEWLFAEPRSLLEVLAHFREAGAGLAAAHAADIIHRDIKPDNLLVGDDGRVRVTDFGLARGSGSRADTGLMVGTPAYMAPEQRSGKQADARSDQYSFCVSLWEGLYGQLPHVQPAGKRQGHSVGRVPRSIRRAVERGLSADPEARFPSMTALLEALQWDPAARRRALMAGALVLIVTVGAALVIRASARARLCSGGEERFARVLGPERRRALDAPLPGSGAIAEEVGARRRERLKHLDEYHAQWLALYSDACQATRVLGDQSDELMELRMSCLDDRLQSVEVLTSLLERNDPAVERRLAGRDVLEPIADCANRNALLQPLRPPRDPAIRERVKSTRTEAKRVAALVRAGEYAAAKKEVKPLVDKARALGYQPLLAEALLQLASVEDHEADPAAERDYLEAALVGEAAHEDRVVAQARVGLVWVVGVRNGKEAEGRKLAREAMAAVDRSGDEIARLNLLDDRALLAESNPHEAESLYKELIAQLANSVGSQRMELGRAENNLGNLYLALGQLDDAMPHVERSIAVEEALLGAHHPQVLLVKRNRVQLIGALGRWSEVTAEARDLAAQTEAVLGPDHVDTGTGLLYYGEALADNPATRADALPLYARAKKIFSARLPPESDEVTSVNKLWCQDLEVMRRYAEAGPLCDAFLAGAEKSPGVLNHDLCDALRLHADLLLANGRFAEAEKEIARALIVVPNLPPEVRADLEKLRDRATRHRRQ